jgi:hypothetical protein
MKRKWLWVWAGVLFLLGMFPLFVCPHLHRPGAADRAVLSPRAWISAWCATVPTAIPPLAWSRAGPRKSFSSHLEFLIAADVDPPWLDHRGPPGPCGCSRLGFVVVRLKGSVGNRQGTSLANFSANPKTRSFSTAFS